MAVLGVVEVEDILIVHIDISLIKCGKTNLNFR